MESRLSTVARLRRLVGVADAGSVREAARRLTVTESAVSAALAALAREVRAPLVEREGRGLRLTGAGEAYAGYARQILGLHEEALNAARSGADPQSGRVRVAAVTSAGEHLLPPQLATFLDRHPQVDLRLEVGSSERVWAMFAAHQADLVVGGGRADRDPRPRHPAAPPLAGGDPWPAGGRDCPARRAPDHGRGLAVPSGQEISIKSSSITENT